MFCKLWSVPTLVFVYLVCSSVLCLDMLKHSAVLDVFMLLHLIM